MKYITIICLSLLVGMKIGYEINDKLLDQCKAQYNEAMNDYFTCDINYTDLRMDCR